MAIEERIFLLEPLERHFLAGLRGQEVIPPQRKQRNKPSMLQMVRPVHGSSHRSSGEIKRLLFYRVPQIVHTMENCEESTVDAWEKIALYSSIAIIYWPLAE